MSSHPKHLIQKIIVTFLQKQRMVNTHCEFSQNSAKILRLILMPNVNVKWWFEKISSQQVNFYDQKSCAEFIIFQLISVSVMKRVSTFWTHFWEFLQMLTFWSGYSRLINRQTFNYPSLNSHQVDGCFMHLRVATVEISWLFDTLNQVNSH